MAAARAARAAPLAARPARARAPRRARAAASAGAVVPVELDVTKLSAAANKVVVEPETVMNATAGGLLLSQGVDKSQSFKMGTIVSVGSEVPAGDLKKGGKVIYSAQKGVEVSTGEGTVTFLNIDEVLATVE